MKKASVLTKESKPGARLMSLDALRGFDMFFITGGAGLSLLLCLFFVYVLGMPVVKKIWTSSFILAAAAYSFAMLAVFHWFVDVKGWRKWTFYFRVIGMNSITIYMLMNMGVIGALRRFFFTGIQNAADKDWHQFLGGCFTQATCWAVLYFFYRRKIFLKV